MVSAGAGVVRSWQPDRNRSPEAVPPRIPTNPNLAIAERTRDAQQAFRPVRPNEPTAAPSERT
jgi:hypothetical protein